MKAVICCWLLISCFVALPTAWALRCDKGLVDIGDPKSEVLLRCGPPLTSTLVAIEKSLDKTGGASSEVPVESWSYDFGSGNFQQILTFHGDTLSAIETGGRISAIMGRGDRLQASVGDTMAEVRLKNGEPAFSEFLGTQTAAVTAAERDLPAARIEVPVDRWTYRFGSGKFMQVLTFRGGKLALIESGARE